MGAFTDRNGHPVIQLFVCLLECGGDDDKSALWQCRVEKDVLRLDVVGRHLRALEGFLETCHNGTSASALRRMEAGPERFVLISWKLNMMAEPFTCILWSLYLRFSSTRMMWKPMTASSCF